MRKKADFLDARAVSGIVNAHIQYRRIANPTKRGSGEGGTRTDEGRYCLVGE